MPFRRSTTSESIDIVGCPVDAIVPELITPAVEPLVIVKGTMTGAAASGPAGPWMCAADAGPLSPVTVTDYEIN